MLNCHIWINLRISDSESMVKREILTATDASSLAKSLPFFICFARSPVIELYYEDVFLLLAVFIS